MGCISPSRSWASAPWIRHCNNSNNNNNNDNNSTRPTRIRFYTRTKKISVFLIQRTQLSCSSLRSSNISCNIGPGPLVKSATSFLACSYCFSFNIGFSVSRYSFVVRSNKGTGSFGSFVWKIKTYEVGTQLIIIFYGESNI